MGKYLVFIFQGQTKANLPHEIKELIGYIFDNEGGFDYEPSNLPSHPFFKCDRWRHIGHVDRYWFSPFMLRAKQEYNHEADTQHVFLICNLKNYNDEIELFLDWLDPYMKFYWGHYCYEEDEQPTFFKVRR